VLCSKEHGSVTRVSADKFKLRIILWMKNLGISHHIALTLRRAIINCFQRWQQIMGGHKFKDGCEMGTAVTRLTIAQDTGW